MQRNFAHKLENRAICAILKSEFVEQNGGTELWQRKTPPTLGLKKQIWDAACVLRGNMDASEYKSVVLGLIFPKYILKLY